MADLNVSLGLQADGLINGATQAVRALDGMNKSAQSLGKKLLEEQILLEQGANALKLHKISSANLTDTDKKRLLTMELMTQKIAAERKAEQDRIDGARELQAAFAREEAAAKKAQQAVLQQAMAKKKAIADEVSAMQAEAMALKRSAAQQKLYELRVQGATQAQLKQAAAAQAQIAAHNRAQQGMLGGMGGGLGGSSIGTLAMGAIGLGSASGVLRAADDWTVFQNRLKLVTQTSAELKTAQEGILAIAKRTGQDLGSTAEVYQRLAANQKELHLNGTQLLNITETINKAIVVGGSTAEGAAAALTQFGQAMASGILRGQEFNSVMEQAPGLARALADGLGVGVGQLRAMANSGELTASVVTQALEKASGSVAAQFAKMDLTIAQSATIFKTNLTEFVGKSSEASSAAGLLSGAIRFAAENVDKLAVGVGALVAISLGKWMVGALASTVQYSASVLLLASNAGTAAGANATLAASVNAVGARAALASFQVTGFLGSLAVLRTAAMATVAPLWAMVAPLAPFAAGAAAAAAGLTALVAAYKFAKGEDASNWISDGFDGLLDKLGVLDSETESLGTKFYDWLNPIDEANAKLQKTQQLIAKTEAQSGYQSSAEKIQQAGSSAAYEAQQMGLEDLKKSLDDSVLKHQKQAEAIGKSTIELEKMRLEAQKQQALIKAESEFKQKYKDQDNAAELVKQSLAKNAAEWDKSIASVVSNMQATETATKARTEAEKAQTAALERAKALQDSLQGLQDDFERVGKSAQELKLMDLQKQGATAAQLAQAKAILEATAAKEAAFKAQQEKLGNAGSSFQAAADTMKSAADKMNGGGESIIDKRYNELMAKANAYNKARDAEMVGKKSAAQQVYESRMTNGKFTAFNNADAIKAKQQILDGTAHLQEALEAASMGFMQAQMRGNQELAAAYNQSAQTIREQLNAQLAAQRLPENTMYGLTQPAQELQTAAIAQQAVAQSLTQQASAQTLATQSLTQAGATMQQAAQTMQQAVSTPQTATPQSMQPQDMGRVTMDLRLPDGKMLTGILFGSKEFLGKLKTVDYQNIESYFNDMRAAVRA